MAVSNYLAMGLMSGTSLDGLDICYVNFQKNDNRWSFEILQAQTIQYNDNWFTQLKNAINLKSQDLLELNVDYGLFLGEAVNQFITEHQITQLDIIASHGHTVFHQPKKKFTLQIGDGRAIRIVTQHNIAYDFRSHDVLLGGNGAPLVPIGDHHLFSEYDACLNLGGFSNISLIKNQKRLAFDICPVNIVLNELALKLGHSMDKNGDIARSGTINLSILEKLNELKFYQHSAPKSLGIEWVMAEITPLLTQDTTENLIATFTEHCAVQIALVLHQQKLKNALITGGGVYNKYLIEKIKAKTKTKIIIPTREIIDYKEALIFAFMGVLRLNNEINILSSATGSMHDHCSGLLLT